MSNGTDIEYHTPSVSMFVTRAEFEPYIGKLAVYEARISEIKQMAEDITALKRNIESLMDHAKIIKRSIYAIGVLLAAHLPGVMSWLSKQLGG